MHRTRYDPVPCRDANEPQGSTSGLCVADCGVDEISRSSFHDCGNTLAVKVELIGEAGAPDIVGQLAGALVGESRSPKRTGREGVIAVELHIEIFAADQPSIGERIFDPGSNRPASAVIGLKSGGGGIGKEKLRAVNFSP